MAENEIKQVEFYRGTQEEYQKTWDKKDSDFYITTDKDQNDNNTKRLYLGEHEFTDAKHIYFRENLTVTEDVGKYKIDEAHPYQELPWANLSVHDAFLEAYCNEINPTKEDPSITSFTISQPKSPSYEIGTSVTNLQIAAEFDQGTYTFKSTGSLAEPIVSVQGTGVSVISWKVVASEGTNKTNTDTLLSGSSNEIEGPLGAWVAGVTGNNETHGNIKFELTVNYSDGNIPLTNLDKVPTDWGTRQIKSGSKTKEVSSASWYRNAFGGGIKDETINSTTIRALSTKSSIASVPTTNAKGITFNAKEGDKKVIFAYPASITKTPQFEIFTMNWDKTTGFEEIASVLVEGASSGYATNYKVWQYSPVGGAFVANETKYRVYFK